MDQATYEISLEQDIECLDLLDETDKYHISEDDENVIVLLLSLTNVEMNAVFSDIEHIKTHYQLNLISAELFASRVIDHEIAEHTMKVTIQKPEGEVINYY